MDAGLVGELAHKTKHASTASETTSLPEQKGFSGFVLLDTQDFTGEPFFYFVLCSLIRTLTFGLRFFDLKVQSGKPSAFTRQ